MARSIHKLTDIGIKAISETGRHSDGGGLYLRVANTTSKSWSFMWNRKGKRFEIGMGSYPAVSLANARKQATKFREIVANGEDPRQLRLKENEPTFSECVEKVLDDMESQWSNEKHRYRWRQTLGSSYCKKIENRRVSDIAMEDVLAVLKPIWEEKTETASRLLGRIERVLNFAKVKGWREGENPAAWRGNLENVLPKPRKLKNGHLAALHYRYVPEFMKELCENQSLAARALELTIFTVGRTGEVLGARWEEFNFTDCLWTVPSSRMKARKEHIVPLTDHAIELLRQLEANKLSDWVFPGQRKEKPISNMAMQMLLRRMKRNDITVHGFRSSFRDWAGDETMFPREIAEGCLAHIIGNSVEQAYRRSTAIERRRQLLNAWTEYCLGSQIDKVVRIHG